MDVLDNNFLKKLFFLIKNSIQHKKIFIFANFIKLLMMYNFNFTSFQGINVFATSKLTNFFENKNEFHLEELFEQEGIIENIKISGQTASNFFEQNTKYTKLFLDYIINDQSGTGNDSKTYKYPFIASELFACELQGILGNFFSDVEIDIEEISHSKSVDISIEESPKINQNQERKIEEKELITALEKISDFGENGVEEKKAERKKKKIGDYLFDNLHDYFKNRPEFINCTSAVYFQKVVAALMNKKGYETAKIIFERNELVASCLKNVNIGPLAEILIRLLLLDSCYSYMNIPIFLTERKELITKIFEQLKNNLDIEIIDSISYILVETINRNTSGNSGRIIVGYILDEKYINLLLSKFNKDLQTNQYIYPYVNILQNLISFCILEETRNTYKSPFVNFVNETDKECDLLCASFLLKFKEKIADFLAFLKNIPKQKLLNTCWKEQIPIFGLEKLKIIELLSLVLKFKNENLLIELLDCDVFAILFELFKSHPFHSILQNILYQFIKQCFDLNHPRINELFFEKKILLDFIMNLSKDDTLRINSSSKKIPKGYNGFVILFIQMIYNPQTLSSDIESMLESNILWKAFLTDYYQPQIHKIAVELGGYHPRTKKESFDAFKVEDDEPFYHSQKNTENDESSAYSSKAKPESQNFNGWNGNKGMDFETHGDYDYYYEDDLSLSLSLLKQEKEKEKQEQEKQEKEKQEKQEKEEQEKKNENNKNNEINNQNLENKNNGLYKIEENNDFIEYDNTKNLGGFLNYEESNNISSKCRYEYEDYYSFD